MCLAKPLYGLTAVPRVRIRRSTPTTERRRVIRDSVSPHRITPSFSGLPNCNGEEQLSVADARMKQETRWGRKRRPVPEKLPYGNRCRVSRMRISRAFPLPAPNLHSSSPMFSSMAGRTERNEIRFGVGSSMAPEVLMVDFEVRHRAARLAAPAISAQYALPLGFI